MSTMQTFYFKNWQECLAETDFRDNLKTAYRYTIIAFLAYLKEHAELATVDNARVFIETKMRRERPEEWKAQRWKDSLNWFFRNAPVRRQADARKRKSEAVKSASEAVKSASEAVKSENPGKSSQESAQPQPCETNEVDEGHGDGRRQHPVTVREYQNSVGPDPMIEAAVRLMRVRHMAYSTEEAYIGWLRRFARFHEEKHMDALGEEELKQFLSYIAVEEGGSAGTQRQALNAGVFLPPGGAEARAGGFQRLCGCEPQQVSPGGLFSAGGACAV